MKAHFVNKHTSESNWEQAFTIVVTIVIITSKVQIKIYYSLLHVY